MSVRFLSGINVDSNTLVVDDVNNRVGIGTASPATTLHVDGDARITSDFTAQGDTITFLNENSGNKNINIRKRFDGSSYINWIRNSNTDAYIGVDESENFQIGYASSGLNRSLIFTSNNSEVIRFDLSGNVGIGTTSPDYKLDVENLSGETWIRANSATSSDVGYRFARNGVNKWVIYNQGSSDDFEIYQNSATTSRLRITSAGNVGIGTTSPARILTVSAPSGDTLLRTNAVTGSYTGLELTENNSTTSGQYWQINKVPTSHRLQFWNGSEKLTILSNGNVGIGTTAPTSKLNVSGGGIDVQSSTDSLRLRFYEGTTFRSGLQQVLNAGEMITGSTVGDFAIRANAGNMLFSAGGSTERMRITSAGNVGIGTTSPSQQLHIVNANDAVVKIESNGTDSTDDARIELTTTNGTFSIQNDKSLGTSGALTFAGNVSNNIVIDHNTGNVGIGTTSPAYKLDVNGDANFGSINVADGGLITWVRTYSVSNTVVLPLLNTDGNNILTGGAYRVTAHIDGTGTDQSSKAVFWNQNGTWYLNETSRSGISSNHIQFLIDSGVPSVKTWHANLYNVRVLHEWINLYEGTGTDNTKDFWGTDAYMSNIVGNVTFNNGGNVIIPAGNVGIGTTSPTYKFEVSNGTQTGTFNPNSSGFMFLGSTSNHPLYFGVNDSTKVVILSNGNVGIGTTSPQQKLHIEGNIYMGPNNTNNFIHSGAHLGLQADGEVKIVSDVNDTSGVAGSDIIFGYGSSTNTDSNQDFTELELGTYPRVETMRIQASTGNVGIGTTGPSEKLDVAGNIRIASNNGYISFNTSASSGDPKIKMGSDGDFSFLNTAGNNTFHIENGGNVGIGTTTPSGKLQVELGSSNSYDSATLTTPIAIVSNINSSNVNNQAAGLHLYTTGWAGSTTGVVSLNAIQIGGNASTADFAIQTRNAGVYAERFRLTAAGNVGIGTTSPGATLTVGTQSSGTSGSGVAQDNSIIARFGASNTASRVTGATIANTATATVGNDATLSFIVAGNYSATGLISAILRNTSIASTDMAFSVYNNSMQERMRITSGGNVGIGTTSPGSLLQVGNAGAAPTGLATLTLTGANTAPQIATKPGLYHRHAIGLGVFSDYAISFQVNGSSALSDAMLITNTGNVGIGTTAPLAQLQVTSATNNVDVLRIGNTAGDSGSVQGVTHLAINHFNAGTNPSTRITAYQDGVSGWPGGMYFSTRSLNTDSAPLERMRIASGGNVGINTTLPTHILHVVGQPRFDSSGGQPATTTSPVTQLKYAGYNSFVLTDPDTWLKVSINGTDYVIPAYAG